MCGLYQAETRKIAGSPNSVTIALKILMFPDSVTIVCFDACVGALSAGGGGCFIYLTITLIVTTASVRYIITFLVTSLEIILFLEF